MSSKYTSANFHLTVDEITSMTRWNVQGAFLKPKGIRINRYSLLCEVNDVFTEYYGSIYTFQFPELASNVEKIFASPSESVFFSIRSMGYEYLTVTPSSFR